MPKCEITYVEQCHYEHYEQVCESVPVPVVRQAKEIECQRCRKYKVPVPKTKWVKECNPVYDEKCKTEYHQHCKQETRCHMLYQTICDNAAQGGYGGYEQQCESQPRQHCYPETKCHRTPETVCVPIQKENCVKVPQEGVEYKEEKQCLPFDISVQQLEAQHGGDPCAGYQQPTGYDQQQTGYGQQYGVDVGLHGGGGQQFGGGYGVQQQAPVFHQPAHLTAFDGGHGHTQNYGGAIIQQQDQYVQPTVQQHHIQQAPVYIPQGPPAYPAQVQHHSQAVPIYNPDPVLQYQPQEFSNQYNVKRKVPQNGRYNPAAVGNDNPFLRRPKQLVVDDESSGWIPIPYPIAGRKR